MSTRQVNYASEKAIPALAATLGTPVATTDRQPLNLEDGAGMCSAATYLHVSLGT